MKERLFNVIKWFFIILGILFLFQLLIAFGLFLGIMGFVDEGIGVINYDKRMKPMQHAIKYIENYRNQNGKYPQNIDGIKLKKNLEYKYETTKDSNCYVLIIKSKKDNFTKQYQHCFFNTENGASNTHSYSEYNN
ncbi:hypothetical protein IJ425_00195 [bacterium]|nr:hypothetical protein [bacterium]